MVKDVGRNFHFVSYLVQIQTAVPSVDPSAMRYTESAQHFLPTLRIKPLHALQREAKQLNLVQNS